MMSGWLVGRVVVSFWLCAGCGCGGGGVFLACLLSPWEEEEGEEPPLLLLLSAAAALRRRSAAPASASLLCSLSAHPHSHTRTSVLLLKRVLSALSAPLACVLCPVTGPQLASPPLWLRLLTPLSRPSSASSGWSCAHSKIIFRPQTRNIHLQLSTTDILAPASMKNAANCET